MFNPGEPTELKSTIFFQFFNCNFYFFYFYVYIFIFYLFISWLMLNAATKSEQIYIFFNNGQINFKNPEEICYLGFSVLFYFTFAECIKNITFITIQYKIKTQFCKSATLNILHMLSDARAAGKLGVISKRRVDWTSGNRKLRIQRLFQRLFETGTNKCIKSIVFAYAGQSQQVVNSFLYRTGGYSTPLETAQD